MENSIALPCVYLGFAIPVIVYGIKKRHVFGGWGGFEFLYFYRVVLAVLAILYAVHVPWRETLKVPLSLLVCAITIWLWTFGFPSAFCTNNVRIRTYAHLWWVFLIAPFIFSSSLMERSVVIFMAINFLSSAVFFPLTLMCGALAEVPNANTKRYFLMQGQSGRVSYVLYNSLSALVVAMRMSDDNLVFTFGVYLILAFGEIPFFLYFFHFCCSGDVDSEDIKLADFHPWSAVKNIHKFITLYENIHESASRGDVTNVGQYLEGRKEKVMWWIVLISRDEHVRAYVANRIISRTEFTGEGVLWYLNVLDLQNDHDLYRCLVRISAFSKPGLIGYSTLQDVQVLSEGNFGKVFEAKLEFNFNPKQNSGVKKMVSISVVCKIAKGQAGDDEVYESQVLKNVPYHPNISNLLGVCMDFAHGGKLNYANVVLFHLGGSLDKYITSLREIDVVQVLNFTLDIVKGISHLHKNEYVHRDIGLRNCLLFLKPDDDEVNQITDPIYTHMQRVVVTDFGLTRPISWKSPAGKDIFLHWRTSAPEVFRSFECSRASDVWMIGLTIWEMYHCKNYVAFHWCKNIATLSKTFKEHSEDEVPLMFKKDCPKTVRSLIFECCKFDPLRRISLNSLQLELESQILEAGKDQQRHSESLNEESKSSENVQVGDPPYVDVDGSVTEQKEEELVNVDPEYIYVGRSSHGEYIDLQPEEV